ncbi:MAG: pilus assembly protein [Chloroflexi bacterium]|nr:pilus assembly protein [Chloroflexota bacterium]
MKTRKKSERGQSLVELAISLLVLLYLLSGVVEFGIDFFQFIQLRDAAQEGALYGSINPGVLSPIETRVRNASDSPIDLSVTSGPQAVTVTVKAYDDATGNEIPNLADACVGDGIRVDVSFNHQIFMPFISRLIGAHNNTPPNTIPLTGSVTDTILQSTATGCS